MTNTKFAIRNAFDRSCCSGEVASCYENDIDLHAKTLEEAIKEAERIQSEHDALAYECAQRTNDMASYDNAPCYPNSLVMIDEEGEETPVEI